MASSSKLFSPKDIATAIGASESSVKRWADGGQLAFTRTVGGHRRIALYEAIRFARESNLPILRPDILGLPDLSLAQDRMASNSGLGDLVFEALLHGQAQEMRVLLVERYLAGESLTTLCDGPVREALSRIGEIWKHEGRGIAIEHRATDICIQALSVLRSFITPDQDDAPIALGGAPEGDPYILPSMMASAVLAEVGFADRNLGANMPTNAMINEIEHARPSLVWLSFSVRGQIERMTADLGRLLDVTDAMGASVIVGGRILDGPLPRALGGRMQHATSMGELAAFSKGLLTVARRQQRSDRQSEHQGEQQGEHSGHAEASA